jgi:3-hydroxypropanoate dehydrogenase
VKANFICNLGYGDPEGIMPRAPRFTFEEFCTIL